MKVIDFSSDLINGEILVRFNFEDDTDVFLSKDGYECINFNNLKSDEFYINLAIDYYFKKYNK